MIIGKFGVYCDSKIFWILITIFIFALSSVNGIMVCEYHDDDLLNWLDRIFKISNENSQYLRKVFAASNHPGVA